MRNIFNFLSLHRTLPGLENILKQMADGQIAPDDAARQIRDLAARLHLPRWFPNLMKFMALISLVISIGLGGYAIVRAIGTKEVLGTVVELVGETSSSPIVAYHVDGKQYTITSIFTSSLPPYYLDEKVPVFYSPDNPHKAMIASIRERWTFPLVFLCNSIFLLMLSYFLSKVLGMSKKTSAK